MKFKTLDDYYTWACDWCDSDNRTLWVRVAQGQLICGACHRSTSSPASAHQTQAQQRMLVGLC